MKLRNLKWIFISFLLIAENTSSHNEFFQFNSCSIERVYATNNENILKWQSYSNIPICYNFDLDFPGGTELIKSQCESDFTWALYEWPNVTFMQMSWDANRYIRVKFTDSEFYFPNPNEAYAGVWHAIVSINNKYYIIDENVQNFCGNGDFMDNWILFNSRTDRNWYWTHNTYIQYNDIVNFRYTLTHELGHEIGLAHCDISSSLMYATPPPAPYFVNWIPQPPDIEGLNIILAQNPVTLLEINPLKFFLNKQHSFFEYTPEILLYSQKKNDKAENDGENPGSNSSSFSEKKLFIMPESNKKEYLKK